MIKYIYSSKASGLKELSETQYRERLTSNSGQAGAQIVTLNDSQAKMAFEKAWETRNFEIEMYWKRATYFWAFIASTFVGYFALISSKNYLEPDMRFNHAEVYFLICIGFVLSCAWHFTNIGSKSWQRHWEVHVDLLENSFTGPLYKTVHPTSTYSVSKINEIVSFIFIVTWILLGAKFLFDQDSIRSLGEEFEVNWFVVISSFVAISAVFSMCFGHGRGRFSAREIVMHEGTYKYKNIED